MRDSLTPNFDPDEERGTGRLNEFESYSLDDATLDALDRAEDQIERGEVHAWKDVREQVRAKFFGK